jgi:hypothetical protein
MDLALHEKLIGMLELSGAPEADVAWVVGVTPRQMWQLTDRPAGTTAILWRRLAQLHGIEFELLVGGSAQDALTAALAALPESPLTHLQRGDINREQLRRDLCGEV